MSEERLDRIENQLTQVIQNTTVMQQNMTVMQQNMTTMQQNIEDKHNLLVQIMTTGFASLDQRFDTVDNSLTHLAQQVNDINIDLTVNEQKTEDNARKNRRINQRLMRLEQQNDEI
jgi:chromosome segregation ATPase